MENLVVKMPRPRKGEKKSEFISRCISMVIKESGTKSQAHAIAKCHGIWKQHLKKKRKR